jgi:hypothetical protein
MDVGLSNRHWICFSFTFLFLLSTCPAQNFRFQKLTRHYQDPPDPVTIETATYLGSKGSEWLSGGGFLPDGRLLVGGTSWGPSLEIAGREAEVLGEDNLAAGPIETGTDRKGRKVLPDWRHSNGTPFLVWLSGDLKTVEKQVRLAWKTGAATAMEVDPEGNIFLAGIVGPAFQGSVQAEDILIGRTNASSSAYVIKINSGGDTILWARTMPDAGKGVSLRLSQDRVLVQAAWAYSFSLDGELKEYIELPVDKKKKCAVNPADLSYCLGFDRNTRTGHEPWRQPCLQIMPSSAQLEKGAQEKKLYQWSPKLVGSKPYRLVSDSSFQTMHYAHDGALWAVGWSDGGNTVLRRQPLDLDAPTPFKGLGFSAWGAGVLGLSHIIKLDPSTCELQGQTLWCGFLSNVDKPNTVIVNALSIATDGSVLLGGNSAFGLIQTGDALHHDPAAPGGPYIAVLNKDLSSIRFSSAMVACAKVNVSDDRTQWRIVPSIVNNRHKVLFLTSAIQEEAGYAALAPAPTRQAMQPAFAGGESDGYFVLMDLGPVE